MLRQACCRIGRRASTCGTATFNSSSTSANTLSFVPNQAGRCSIHSSPLLRRTERIKTSNVERQLITEVADLQRQLYDAAVDGHGIKKNDTTLPEVTEDMLDDVYEALQMPSPPTEEELRQEQKRIARLERHTSNLPHVERLRLEALQRLTDLESRLQNAQRYIQERQKDRGNESYTARLLEAIQQGETQNLDVKSSQQSELSSAETAVGENGNSDVSIGKLTTEARIRQVLDSIHSVSSSLAEITKIDSSTQTIPQGILDLSDWKAISRTLAETGSLDGIGQLLRIMESSGSSSTRLPAANAALFMFALRGEAGQCMALHNIMQECGLAANEFTKHCLVKSYVTCSRFDDAIALIQSFETSTPASLETYTYLIQNLLSQGSNQLVQTKAWSVFTQMRFAAHPIPDAMLYAQMIKACAQGVPQPQENIWRPKTYLASPQVRKSGTFSTTRRTSDAERAMDLFREMTVHYQIRPTPEVYASVILACSRRKGWYLTGVKLFQSMLEHERHRVAAKNLDSPSYAPDRQTYNALLHGCAKNGDLVRARWILAEMLRSSIAHTSALQECNDVTPIEVQEVMLRRPDAQTLTHLCYTYASYTPPAPLQHVKPIQNSASNTSAASSGKIAKQEENAETEIQEGSTTIETGDDTATSFSEQVPATSGHILREVVGLLERVNYDFGRRDGLLSSVKPSNQLLASFLAVTAQHTTGLEQLERIEEAMFGNAGDVAALSNGWLNFTQGQSLYEHWSLKIDGQACSIALGACSKHRERKVADLLAEKVWNAFKALGDSSVSQTTSTQGSGTDVRFDKNAEKVRTHTLDPETISRCWTYMIRNLAKSYRLDEAIDKLREFVDLYPPSSHSKGREPRSAMQKSMSSGQNERPCMPFSNVEIVYERLTTFVASNAEEEEKRIGHIRYLTYVCRAYEADLRPTKPKILQNALPTVERYKQRRRR